MTPIYSLPSVKTYHGFFMANKLLTEKVVYFPLAYKD